MHFQPFSVLFSLPFFLLFSLLRKMRVFFEVLPFVMLVTCLVFVFLVFYLQNCYARLANIVVCPLPPGPLCKLWLAWWSRNSGVRALVLTTSHKRLACLTAVAHRQPKEQWWSGGHTSEKTEFNQRCLIISISANVDPPLRSLCWPWPVWGLESEGANIGISGNNYTGPNFFYALGLNTYFLNG